jgi:hypothetical protein
MKKKKARTIVLTIAAVVGLLLFAVALTRAHVSLVAPHTTKPSAATLDPALRGAVEFLLGGDARPHTVEDAIRFSLKQTSARLHFGLGHPTNLSFSAAEREANCIEYSHMFARVFGMAAEKGKLSARAYVVHSARAEVFGSVVPLPGMRDHDWVLVVDDTSSENQLWFVDPTFDDALLGWDLKENVAGEVKPPSR